MSFTDSGTQAIVGANAPPSATVALTPTTAGTNDVLTATATKSDPESDPISLTWEWRVNGVLQRTFTSGSALTDTFDLVAGRQRRRWATPSPSRSPRRTPRTPERRSTRA